MITGVLWLMKSSLKCSYHDSNQYVQVYTVDEKQDQDPEDISSLRLQRLITLYWTRLVQSLLNLLTQDHIFTVSI